MMTIQQKIKEVPGLLYVVDNMELMSSIGRQRMMEQPLLTQVADIGHAQQDVQLLHDALRCDTYTHAINKLRHQLMQLHDLRTSFRSLAAQIVLTEVELFEIKAFVHLCGQARQALTEMTIAERFPLPDLQPVFQLLDPDATGIANFYIYDTYDTRLEPIRRKMKSCSDTDLADLMAAQNEIQQEVISRLCGQLHPHAEDLATAIEQMAYLDFTLARATLAEAWHLSVPKIGNCSSAGSGEEFAALLSFQQLANPRLKQHNESQGLRYQPIDLEVGAGATLITGANMAGKTVLLKSVGVAQLMFQFGFPVPAAAATLCPVDDVVFCIGDEQNEMNGLSSFAAEITRISDVLRRSATERMLILIDEPARTTNPVEGKALVQAILRLLQQRDSITLVTTHYSQLGTSCRRLRVKGFVESMIDIPLTAQNINRFIDYSLIPDSSDAVPQEALRIAEMLSCDATLIATARECLEE